MGAAGTTKDWDSSLGISEQLEAEIEAEKLNAASGEPEVVEASYNADQIREIAQRDLNMLAGLALPDVFQYLFPKVLLAAWQLLVQSVQKSRDFSKIALGIPRGHGKTTLIKLFVLWVLLFTNRRFILVLSDTAQKAENIVADIMDMLSERNIQILFGDWKLGLEKDTQNVKKFGFRGRNIIIAALGAGGSVRGLNLKNARPDVMIFDDVQSKECAESAVQSGALERWMIGTAMKAKSPHGCLFIFAGNMFPGPNSLLKKLKNNPSWIKFISGAILADGTALWPELHPIEAILAEFDNDIAMGHPEIFFSETLNDTEAGINTSFDMTKIREWPWSPEDRPQGKFIVIDPAKGGPKGDAVAIGRFDVYDEVPAMREVVEEILSPGNTIRTALLMALKHNIRVIAVESVAYQATLLYWFEYVCRELGLSGFHFVEVHSTSVSKNTRIQTMLNSLQAGEIILHPSVTSQVTSQIANWKPMKRDNVDGILDLLTYSKKIIELYGPLCATEDNLTVIEGEALGVIENNACF